MGFQGRKLHIKKFYIINPKCVNKVYDNKDIDDVWDNIELLQFKTKEKGLKIKQKLRKQKENALNTNK